MKRLFVAVFTLISVLYFHFSIHVTTAFAQGQLYACILSPDAYFHQTDDEKSELFLLPETYFVKVLHQGERFTKVEYFTDGEQKKSIVGYVKTDKLTLVDYVPNTPHPSITFQVEYTIDSSQNDPLLSPILINCTFYGEYQVGSKRYCYVLQGDEFTYVPTPENFAYPRSDEYANRTPTESTNSSIEHTPTTNNQVGVIVLISILIPVLAALILRSPKKPVFEQEDI